MPRKRKSASQKEEEERRKEERRLSREQERIYVQRERERERKAQEREQERLRKDREAAERRKLAEENKREGERVAEAARVQCENTRMERERERLARAEAVAQRQREVAERRAQLVAEREQRKQRTRERLAEIDRREQLTDVQRHHEDLEQFNASAALHDLGGCVLMCIFCGALHWLAEKLANSSDGNPRFSKCCSRGKVKLPSLSGRAPVLDRWLGDMSQRGKTFPEDIQKYNNVFAFTSIGMKQDLSTWGPQGIYNLRVNGRVGHLLGHLSQRTMACPYLHRSTC
jgi:hypothetical protein